jgi:phytoene desaturase
LANGTPFFSFLPMRTVSSQRAAVIGGGVGGLACAALLARSGLRVTLFEKNATLGGKLNWLEAEGYSWDTGPSLLTMPYVFEDLWRQLGRRLADDLTFVPLPVTCRYRWPDGTLIDEDAAFWARPDVARFLAYAQGIYELSADAFLHHPLDEWWRQLRLSNLPKLRHLPKIASLQSMDQVVRRFFGHDPHLVQLFDRFATYNGSSPYRTPGAFNIIPYVEARFGGWYVKGGLYQIARALGRIAEELGVEIQLNCEVTGIQQAVAVVYDRRNPLGDETFSVEYTGGSAQFDHVICNQDVLSAYPRFLPVKLAEEFRRSRVEVLDPSFSSFLLYLGVGREYPQLAHHNIFFSNDYPAEFNGLFSGTAPVAEPTIYVAIHSKAEAGRAPPGCENWFVLVNAPALDPQAPLDWAASAGAYGDRIIERLETVFGLAGLAAAVRVRRHFTPDDFQSRYFAHRGSLYGFASHGPWAAFQRPGLQPPGWRNFYFVGGSTHPGGGLPLVCLSAQMVAAKILRQLQKKR